MCYVGQLFLGLGPAMEYGCPVTLHWRKIIFTFSTGFNCKKLLGYGWDLMTTPLPSASILSGFYRDSRVKILETHKRTALEPPRDPPYVGDSCEVWTICEALGYYLSLMHDIAYWSPSPTVGRMPCSFLMQDGEGLGPALI